MYSAMQFQQYLHQNAVGIVQVDVARVGGITPWLNVAHMAESFYVKVCPHFLTRALSIPFNLGTK